MKLIIQCAWCKRLKSGERWFTALQPIKPHEGSAISHGICPECKLKHFSPVSPMTGESFPESFVTESQDVTVAPSLGLFPGGPGNSSH